MFTTEELILIHEDQKDFLENYHLQDNFECDQYPFDKIMDCPFNHFENNVDLGDIKIRQSIMRKITGATSSQKKYRRRRVMFVGKDHSLWDFCELTGLPHPRTDDPEELAKYARTAVLCDDRLDRFVIMEVEV